MGGVAVLRRGRLLSAGTTHGLAGGNDAPATAEFRHRAFISYSRSDQRLAVALQYGLEQLAKPRRRARVFDVFVDTTDLPGGGHLPDRLSDALRTSAHLVVLASPAAGASSWVAKEVAEWLSVRGSDGVIIVLVGGTLAWNETPASGKPGWTEESLTSLPGPLHDAFTFEPLWVDMRSHADRDAARLTLDDAEFKYNVARIQAPLRGEDVRPSDIVGEDLDLFRAAERRRRRAVLALAGLTTVAVIAGLVAIRYADRSARQARVALSKQLAVQSTGNSGTQLDLGLLLAVESGEIDDNADSFGRLVDAASRSADIVSLLHGHERPVRALAVDASGTLLASADIGGAILLWDLDRLMPVGGPLPVEFSGSTILQDLEFSPDGSQLVAAGFDGALHRWDVSRPDQVRVLPSIVPAGGDNVASVAFAPDGSWLVSAGGVAADGTCQSTRPTPIMRTEFDGGTSVEIGQVVGCALALDVSADGRLVAVGDQVGAIHLFDPLGVITEREFPAHGDAVVSDLTFAPDGTLLVSVGWDEVARVWDLADTEEPLVEFAGHESTIRSVSVSAAGVVATADRAHDVELWDIRTGQVVRQMSTTHAAEVRDVVFVPGTDRLVSGAADRLVAVWDVSGDRSLSVGLGDPDSWAVAFDASSSTLVSVGGPISGDAASGPGWVRWTPIGRDGTATTTEVVSAPLAVAAAAGVTVLGAVDGSIDIRDTADGSPRRRWNVAELGCPLATGNPIRVVDVRRDGSVLAAGYFDGSIVVIEDPLGDARVRCQSASGVVRGIAFDPRTGDVVATNGDDRLLVWSLQTDRVRLVTVATDTVNAVAFDPSGRIVATGAVNGDIALLDAASLRPIRQPFNGAQVAVVDLAFSPRRSLLASAGVDGSVVLWNVETGLELTEPIVVHANAVRAVTWLAEGAGLATAAGDRTRVWDLQLSTLRRLTCGAAGRSLTEPEWEAFVGADRGYAATCDDVLDGGGDTG